MKNNVFQVVPQHDLCYVNVLTVKSRILADEVFIAAPYKSYPRGYYNISKNACSQGHFAHRFNYAAVRWAKTCCARISAFIITYQKCFYKRLFIIKINLQISSCTNIYNMISYLYVFYLLLSTNIKIRRYT